MLNLGTKILKLLKTGNGNEILQTLSFFVLCASFVTVTKYRHFFFVKLRCKLQHQSISKNFIFLCTFNKDATFLKQEAANINLSIV